MPAADSRSIDDHQGPLRGLIESPVMLPALAAIVLFVVWAGSQAGYPVTHWAPGSLIVLVLLAITLACVPLRLTEVPLPVRVAVAALAAYTALSYFSILWAKVPGDAWEGANRTLLYLLVFVLFACWRQRAGGAALLLCAWTLALVGVALYTALHIATASAGLPGLLPEGRLIYPAGYANANAAQWLMAFWPTLFLASSARLHWALRGVLAGGAVLLADVALLSQSRGSVYATAAMLVFVFCLLPGRLRIFALLLPVALAVGLSAPFVLQVGDHLRHEEVVRSTLHAGIEATFLAALVAGALVALAAAIESGQHFSQAASQRIQRTVRLAAATTLLAIVAGGLALAGNPLTRVSHAWHTFKGGYGADSTTGSRLVSGLGSNRYDFYRVALDEFAKHPLLGIGADNFQQQYLRHGHSDETPRYPHSVELRTLSQTGLAGAALAVLGLGAALLAAARALRSDEQLARTVAAGALAGFAYWALHGSVNWFWEFAGLGAPAFALLGISCALSASAPEWSFSSNWSTPRLPRAIVLVLAGLACAASLAAPWFSQLQIQAAARVCGYANRIEHMRC